MKHANVLRDAIQGPLERTIEPRLESQSIEFNREKIYSLNHLKNNNDIWDLKVTRYRV